MSSFDNDNNQNPNNDNNSSNGINWNINQDDIDFCKSNGVDITKKTETITAKSNVDNNNSSHSSNIILPLKLNENIEKEGFVSSFALHKRTGNIHILFNHKYNRKVIVFSIDSKKWQNNIKSLETRAGTKEISDKHIAMLTDVLDENCQTIIDICSNSNGNGQGQHQQLKETASQKAKRKIIEEIKRLKEENKGITFDQWQSTLNQKYQRLKQIVNDDMPEAWTGLEFELSVMRILNLYGCDQPFAGVMLGPPSSYKTAVIGLLKKWPTTFYTDNFTAKSFVSHTTSVKTEAELRSIDLLPKIKNKMFLTPELSPTFTLKEDDLRVIFGIITRIVDGHGYQGDSGVWGHRGYDEHIMFTWIGAAVDVPKKVYKLLWVLGAKLYFMRLPATDKTVNDLAIEDTLDEFNVRLRRIEAVLMDYLKWFEIHPYAELEPDPEDQEEKEKKEEKADNSNQTKSEESELRLIRIKKDRSKDEERALWCIRNLATLLAHLRQPAVTRDTKDGQGSDYAYSVSQVENATRAYNLLKNLGRGHALLTGRSYLTVEDVPILIKMVLSTAHIDRVSMFDLLLNHDGTLTSKIIIDSLNVSRPTALKTMLELKVIRLVTADLEREDGAYNAIKKIDLDKNRYGWFLSDEFKKLREGFVPVDYKTSTTLMAEAFEEEELNQEGVADIRKLLNKNAVWTGSKWECNLCDTKSRYKDDKFGMTRHIWDKHNDEIIRQQDEEEEEESP